MSQSFDIYVLREEARTRWLRPAEVYYILQNHERFPITPEPPEKPPSGSLFLYDRRVNRHFRTDGHPWRTKKDGRTVAEAQEKLKVENIYALCCYYAQVKVEQEPCFQRRCFRMLEPAYEHIVLVHYKVVEEGGNYSSQTSNVPSEPLASLSYPNAIYWNQCHNSASGIGEGSESHRSYSYLSSLTEVTSYSVSKEKNRDGGTSLSIPELGQTCPEKNTEVYWADNGNTANKSGLNVALKNIVEQLSLGGEAEDDYICILKKDDYIYSNQAQPFGYAKNVDAAGGNQLRQIQPEGIQNGLGRNIAPPWEDVLHCISGLPTSSVYQLEPYSRADTRHSLGQKQLFQLREISPEWAFSHEVEELHPTLHEDVKAWINMKKQYGGDLHHTCVQIDSEVLGRNDIKHLITKKILLDRNGGNKCTVICINAGSGHGKTSMLCVIYNDQQLINAFDKRIWIQMSDKSDISMLFRKIVEFTMNDHCSITNLRDLEEMVEEELTDNKFILFLDDADIEDRQFWNSVLKVLNVCASGSVVVMATRSATIATLSGPGLATHSYSLNPLSEENNLVLLQQYAILGTDIQSNSDLAIVAKRFISRFGGNILKLKAIGGLLCHADTTSLGNIKLEGSAMPLQLCHDVLPIHLKKCLALCSLFPEGYIFDRHQIILLWISHGCIRPVEGCELEDVGAEYFSDLLRRSFFQHSPFHNDKNEQFIMHELIYKMVESVFRNRYFKSEDLMSSIPENTLYLSLVSSRFQTVELMSITEELKDLQTFLVVQPESEWQQYKISFPTLKVVGLDDFFLKFTFLETLDLSHTDTEELPRSIVSMRNLQYLSINNTSIRALPSEVCILRNLQTLKAKDCRFLTELPGDTKNLLKLRHLDVTKELGHVHWPHGIGHLTELRTLPVFHASGDSSHCCIAELGSLHNLRGCLRLSGLDSVKTSTKAQAVNLKSKQHLKDLMLQWHDSGADIDDDDLNDEVENVSEQVLEGLQPHANLQELAIRGYEGSAFPAWMQMYSSLPSLVSLTLDSCCNCTQFPDLDQLPSLKFLSIRKMYYVQQLSSDISGAGGTKFPSLELLNLWEMYGLEELFEASENDCPRLRKICISRCPDLKRLPSVPSVTELVLHCGLQLPDIQELGSLASLKIEGFHSVSFSLMPAALPVLKKLEIKPCKELVTVHGLEALTTVQRLKIAACPKLVFPRISSMVS